MSPQEIQTWLESHRIDLPYIMDYETAYIESDEEFAQSLDTWFGSDDWQKTGHTFINLGGDSMGSSFALWVRPGHDANLAPVAYFGDDGGFGVLAHDAKTWAQIIAYAPRFATDEAKDDEYFRATPNFEFFLEVMEENGVDTEKAQNTYDSFRKATIQKFGHLPDFEVLTANLDALNAEFAAWIEKLIPQ